MTPRLSKPTPGRRRPRRDTVAPRIAVLSGSAVIAFVVLLGIIALRSPNGLPLVASRTLYAQVPDPGNLQAHSDVRVGGVRIGQVIGVEARERGARITFKVGKDAGRIPADTTVSVRAAGLLGARYLELKPGAAGGDAAAGTTLLAGRRALTNGVPDFLATFDAETRGRLGDLVTGLGGGLSGNGAVLNDALRVAPTDGRLFPIVVASVLQRPGAAQRLLPSLSAGANALDQSKEDLVRALRPTDRALQPFRDEREAFSDTLDELPPTLRAAEPGLRAAQPLLAAARRLSVSAAAHLPRAPGGLRAATALLREADQPLARTSRLLDAAKPAIPAVLALTSAARPVLQPLKRTLDDLGAPVRELGDHACDVDNMLENWRSALGFGTPGEGQDTPLPNGMVGPLNFFRITVLAGPESVQGFSRPSGGAQNKQEAYQAPCVGSPGPRYDEPNANKPTAAGAR